MARLSTTILLVSILAVPAFAQKKGKPDINASQEFPGVYHSPSAESTPPVFRSILQMEVITQAGDSDAQLLYANGTVVSRDGLLASVVHGPSGSDQPNGGITSASVLMHGSTSALWCQLSHPSL